MKLRRIVEWSKYIEEKKKLLLVSREWWTLEAYDMFNMNNMFQISDQPGVKFWRSREEAISEWYKLIQGVSKLLQWNLGDKMLK